MSVRLHSHTRSLHGATDSISEQVFAEFLDEAIGLLASTEDHVFSMDGSTLGIAC